MDLLTKKSPLLSAQAAANPLLSSPQKPDTGQGVFTPQGTTPSIDNASMPPPATQPTVKPPMTLQSSMSNITPAATAPVKPTLGQGVYVPGGPGTDKVTGLKSEAGAIVPGNSNAPALPANPTPITSLPGNEQTNFDQALAENISALTTQSDQAIADIRETGKGKIGSSNSFLASIGALGRSLSGAPIETGLGVLSGVQNSIDRAVAEEKSNLASKIVALKTKQKGEVQTRIDELNKLQQATFDNAIKLVEQNTALDAAAKIAKINDLNATKLQRDLDLGSQQDVLDNIDRMAAGNMPIDQISAEKIAAYEQKLGMPTGAFTKYYEAKLNANKLASAENLQKAAKAKADIEKVIADTEKSKAAGENSLALKGYLPIDPEAIPDAVKQGKTVVNINGQDYLAPTALKTVAKGSTAINPYTNKPVFQSAPTSSAKNISNNTETQAAKEMTKKIGSVVGSDGYISPDDYTKARTAWIGAGYSATTFDTKFKGYRNPNNTNYVTDKQSTAKKSTRVSFKK